MGTFPLGQYSETKQTNKNIGKGFFLLLSTNCKPVYIFGAVSFLRPQTATDRRRKASGSGTALYFLGDGVAQ